MANRTAVAVVVTPQERFPHFPFPEVLDDDRTLLLMRSSMDPAEGIPAPESVEPLADERLVPFEGDLAGAMAQLFAMSPRLILEVYERSCGKDGAHEGNPAVCKALPEAVRRLLATEAKPETPAHLLAHIRDQRRERVLRVLQTTREIRHIREHGRTRIEEGVTYYYRLMQYARSSCPVAQEIGTLLVHTVPPVTH